MVRRGVVALATSALLLAGCVESDIRTEIKEDGSGSLRMSAKMTEGMVKLLKRMEKSKQGGMNGPDAASMKLDKPDDATVKELAALGLRVEEVSSTSTDTEMSARVRLAFDRISSLASASRLNRKGAGAGGGAEIKPGDLAKGLRLTRNDAGVYTLSLGMKSDEEAEGSEVEMEGAEAGPPDGGLAAEAENEAKPAAEGEAKEPPAAEGKEAPEEEPEDPMALMGEMMEEMQNLKITIGFAVPGEIVDFAPDTGGEKKDGAVTWTLDMGTMMAIQMEGVDTFQVRFKLAEGKSLPEAALWSGKTAEKAAAPAAPAPAPGGDGK